MEAKINKYTRKWLGVTSRFVLCGNVLQTSKTKIATEIDYGGIQIQLSQTSNDARWLQG